MKKILGATTIAALFGVVGVANAADVYAPSQGSLKDGYVAPAPTWTGFYIGAHVGGGWTDLSNKNFSIDNHVLPIDAWDNTSSGVVGGGTLGYNWQTGATWFGSGNIVLGVETDFGGVGISKTNRIGTPLIPLYYYNKEDSNFYADVTGRIGYAFGPALFYFKGGWAYLDEPYSVGVTFGPRDFSVKADSADGYTLGGGIEYQFSPSWSFKVEYQYFDFGDKTLTYTKNLGDHSVSVANELELNTIQVGLNYHINASYAPLK